MEKLVRVDVDTQFGFCDEQQGGLPVKGAFNASSAAGLLNRECQELGIPLIGSVDTHEPKDKEFKEQGGMWPPHCIKGLRDWNKMLWTLPEDFRFVTMGGSIPVDAFDKNRAGKTALYFEKNVYSIFDNYIAESYVMALDNWGFHKFEVYGVATDYCVKAAALGIKKLLPNAKVRLLLSACAGVGESTTNAAIEEMFAAGIEIVR